MASSAVLRLKTCAEPPWSAEPFIPASRSLPVLMKAVEHCRGCDLYCNATHGVFGQGTKRADLLFVGEQPGDQEDRAGKPFVGPSGQLLDGVLAESGIDRKQVFVTNAVKHFKWTPRGKRRLHAKPTAREIAACRPWLEKEIQLVHPKLIVCLGATAAQSLMGRTFRLTEHRGECLRTEWAEGLFTTVHPASVLRAPDSAARRESRAAFLSDMKAVSRQLKRLN